MNDETKDIITCLADGGTPPAAGLAEAIGDVDADARGYAAGLAARQTLRIFGDGVFLRGLMEISNHCRNDCFYCGIRRSNAKAERYRLGKDVILDRCRSGHELGLRTFVFQGGEDGALDDDWLADLVETVRREFPDSAITLSLGERSFVSYKRLFDAGADRYLLRHETAVPGHYSRLHPPPLTLKARIESLYMLKEIGYQTGSGFMVGSPFQTPGDLAADLLFLKRLDPAMVGIGPFIPHRDTPFAGYPAGSLGVTLFLISLVRLLLPRALIPATTALASIAPDGRERGLLAGANVVMPNLSPVEARGKYDLYNGKLSSDAEAAENLRELSRRLSEIGRRVEQGRGDYREQE